MREIWGEGVKAYYNEIDPYAAQWLKNLIRENLIANGEVDERSILDVQPDDLRGFDQCHFFAGIGGWPYALRLAKWDDTKPVWTGSCPCQPLSSAGKRKGHADKRHLWPAFFRLISKCKPSVVFGEQVAGQLGYEWLAGIRTDLETDRYAVGAANLCAAGAGAPHGRPRLYWVADANSEREWGKSSQKAGKEIEGESAMGEQYWERFRVVSGGGIGWGNGQQRRLYPESESPTLADGFPGRLAQVRAFGNAIVPQVAARFVEAYIRCAP